MVAAGRLFGAAYTALISALLVIYSQKSCFVDKHSLYFHVRMSRWQRSDKCWKEELGKITAGRKHAGGERDAWNKPRAGTALSVFKGKSLRNVTFNQKGRGLPDLPSFLSQGPWERLRAPAQRAAESTKASWCLLLALLPVSLEGFLRYPGLRCQISRGPSPCLG